MLWLRSTSYSEWRRDGPGGDVSGSSSVWKWLFEVAVWRWLGSESVFFDHFADEGLSLRWYGSDVEGFAQHGFGFVEEIGVFAEESYEGLADLYFSSEFGVHLDAGVGADGVAGFGAPCAEALNGPADLFAVHVGEIAGVSGGECARGSGLMVRCGIVEDGDVAALGCDDLEPGFVGGAAEQDVVGEYCAVFWRSGVSGEVEHPAGEDVRECDQVGRHGMAVLGAVGAHDVDALPDLDPVAGEAAEWLVHAGEECDGASAGGFAGLDHEFGEEL